MRIDVTVADDTDRARDIAIDCARETPWRDVAAHVCRAAGLDSGHPLWARDRAVDAGDTVGQPPLRAGAVLHTSPRVPAERNLWRLEHISGPWAGTVIGLPPTPIVTIGRDPVCDVVLDDLAVSRRHASIVRSGSGLVLVDHDSANGTLVHGCRVTRHRLRTGDVIRLGDSVVRLSALGALPVADDREPLPAVIKLPDVPVRHMATALRWLGFAAPVVLGVCLAVVTGDLRLMAFAAMTPLTLVASLAVHPTRRSRQRRRVAARRRHTAERELAAARAVETRLRHAELPDPVVLFSAGVAAIPAQALTAAGPLTRLGLADLPSRVRTLDGDTDSTELLPLVPLGMDLAGTVLDLRLPPALARGMARWIVMQLVVTHLRTRGVETSLLLDEQSAACWSWARWLPGCVAEVSSSATVRRLEDESRRDPVSATHESGRARRLIVVDMAEQSCAALGSCDAATTILLVSAGQRPPDALTVIPGRSPHQVVVHAAATPDGRTHVLADQVSVEWAEARAREIAARAEMSSVSGVPDSCRLIDLIDPVDQVDADGELGASIRRGWASATSTGAVPVGRSADGRFVIDLVRDGPHALVAGTTGSGKSEFLQSWLVSMALACPPDRIAFILLDFKGGAAFGPLERLPHVCGVLTDLHAGSAERALDSLRAEMQRRERLFAHAGTPDIDAYQRSPHREPVPRLVIAVDEFAALSERLPDVLHALVSVAQRGRSLGMHLVLATQRPTGVVSSDVRANVTLRIALRTSDPSDSHEVIGTDAAYRISAHTPGRAIVLLDGRRAEIQVASVSGRHTLAGDVLVRPLGPWRRPLDVAPGTGYRDVDALVDAVVAAAAAAELPRASTPWRPPLPSELTVDELPCEPAAAAFALIDRPDRQDQLSLTVHLPTGGGVLLTGSAGSGRTSALLAITAAARRTHGSGAVTVVAIDCAGGHLARSVGAPATVLGDDDPARVGAVVEQLTDEVRARRQAGPRGRGLGEPAADAHILCVIDGWEQLLDMSHRHDRGRSADGVLGLLRSCTGTAVTVALTGDRGTLLPAVAGSAATHLLLRTAEPTDVTAIGVPRQRRPTPWPPGRAFRVADGYEVQIARVDDQPMCGYR